MKQFTLKIVTPDGVRYEGPAEEVVVRTTTGDMGIMADHISTVAPLGMGRCTVVMEGERRYGACIGGMITGVGGNVNIVATTFEWAEQIDLDRVLRSHERADKVLKDSASSDTEIALAQARLHRALVRKSVASYQ